MFDLEKDAFPTIDRLANNVSKEVLERVRQVRAWVGGWVGWGRLMRGFAWCLAWPAQDRGEMLQQACCQLLLLQARASLPPSSGLCRQVKQVMGRLIGRVQRLKSELEVGCPGSAAQPQRGIRMGRCHPTPTSRLLMHERQRGMTTRAPPFASPVCLQEILDDDADMQDM